MPSAAVATCHARTLAVADIPRAKRALRSNVARGVRPPYHCCVHPPRRRLPHRRPALHSKSMVGGARPANVPSDHGPPLDSRQGCAERRCGICKRRKRCALAPIREQGWPETGARLFHQPSVARKRSHAAQTMSDPRGCRCLLPVIAPVRRAERAPRRKATVPPARKGRGGAEASGRARGRLDAPGAAGAVGEGRREVFRPSPPPRNGGWMARA